MTTLAQTVQARLNNTDFRATLGFDGFVDTIVKLVKQRVDGEATYFQTMEEWVAYQHERMGKNFSIEVENQTMKLGGNMPIMANALSNLGCQICCIGALGFPSVHPAFQSMNETCSLLTYSNPGITQAMEFDDGKIILGEMDELNRADWSLVKNRIGLENVIDVVSQAQLLAMVNWGEINHGTTFWEGMLDDVLPACEPVNGRVLFFDLADFSKKPAGEILKALTLLPKFCRYGKVVLGLNQNEAKAIGKQLVLDTDHQSMDNLIEQLYRKLEVDTLVIHHRTEAIAINRVQKDSVKSQLVENPKLLTGAGDNFNAGFCMGTLLNLELEQCLQLAHAQSRFYIQHGFSPTIQQLIQSLNS
ncbi:MAG: PfkB family carbohydrate kinase [Flammeovirgaceae bacterium]